MHSAIGTNLRRPEGPDKVSGRSVFVADLAAWLRQRSPGHDEALADLAVVRCAIDQDYAQPGDPIAGATEVAFFPPVTGGSAP